MNDLAVIRIFLSVIMSLATHWKLPSYDGSIFMHLHILQEFFFIFHSVYSVSTDIAAMLVYKFHLASYYVYYIS